MVMPRSRPNPYCLAVDFPYLAEQQPWSVQYTVSQSAFSMVDMGNNAKISYSVLWH